VWIVGFPRCGSASLCDALGQLGWNAVHNPRRWDDLNGRDAAGDLMITAHWADLLGLFPGSRFILNTRDFASWCQSLLRIPSFWTSQGAFARYYRPRVYGTDDPRDTIALARAWKAHHAEVRRRVPHEQLLIYPQPFAWGPLAEFLGVEVPFHPFPQLNRRSADDVRPID